MHPNIIPPPPYCRSTPFFRRDGTDDRAVSIARTAYSRYCGVNRIAYHRDAQGSSSAFNGFGNALRSVCPGCPFPTRLGLSVTRVDSITPGLIWVSREIVPSGLFLGVQTAEGG